MQFKYAIMEFKYAIMQFKYAIMQFKYAIMQFEYVIMQLCYFAHFGSPGCPTLLTELKQKEKDLVSIFSISSH